VSIPASRTFPGTVTPFVEAAQLEGGVCRKCGSLTVLDRDLLLSALDRIDPGELPPLVFKCINAHTEKFWPAELAPVMKRPACVVCGSDLPDAFRKTCSPPCARFVQDKRNEAHAAHNRRHRLYRKAGGYVAFHFPIEAQPWYRGAATAFQPKPRPAWPLFGDVPAAWLDGFRAVYPTIEREPREESRPEPESEPIHRGRPRRSLGRPASPGGYGEVRRGRGRPRKDAATRGALAPSSSPEPMGGGDS
jgi:hypothetical protein